MLDSTEEVNYKNIWTFQSLKSFNYSYCHESPPKRNNSLLQIEICTSKNVNVSLLIDFQSKAGFWNLSLWGSLWPLGSNPIKKVTRRRKCNLCTNWLIWTLELKAWRYKKIQLNSLSNQLGAMLSMS